MGKSTGGSERMNSYFGEDEVVVDGGALAEEFFCFK